MAEVHGEGLAPDTEVADVEDGEVLRQGQHDGLALVAPQRVLLAVLVRDPEALRRGALSSAHPELGICKDKRAGDECEVLYLLNSITVLATFRIFDNP